MTRIAPAQVALAWHDRLRAQWHCGSVYHRQAFDGIRSVAIADVAILIFQWVVDLLVDSDHVRSELDFRDASGLADVPAGPLPSDSQVCDGPLAKRLRWPVATSVLRCAPLRTGCESCVVHVRARSSLMATVPIVRADCTCRSLKRPILSRPSCVLAYPSAHTQAQSDRPVGCEFHAT